jgi:hypothetical protein
MRKGIVRKLTPHGNNAHNAGDRPVVRFLDDPFSWEKGNENYTDVAPARSDGCSRKTRSRRQPACTSTQIR